MAAIDEIINDFLRDAQFRIVEIGNELDENSDFKNCLASLIENDVT